MMHNQYLFIPDPVAETNEGELEGELECWLGVPAV